MKILNWMQRKLNGRQEKKKPILINLPTDNHQREPCKEEFRDWPLELLTIGTFGNKNILKEDPEINSLKKDDPEIIKPHPPSPQDHLQDLTTEEVGKLQIVHYLNNFLVLQEEDSFKSSSVAELEALYKFLNCPSNLVFDRTNGDAFSDESTEKEGHSQHNTRVFLSKGKDANLDNKKSVIGKRSVSFLLKKMFACSSGFSPAPSLRDPVVLLPESKMEKILRAILHKKIYPHSSGSMSSLKKYLESRQMTSANEDDEILHGKTNDGSKWVKTDSEYIVLEI
ncbi:protein NEGATIVE GRAVITROPIC RESPONSE OF ROOTS [Malania oleifera]|uniref:protein NEGATIVE GRAVITROPIC RESPONSE OF ROOTS n=1 Tax=Malania oleifera TaxID=397392 RepID=UPI0025AE1371|nr:protein NEGATIVE GRAVITROPIC RESPONSE OF ROOTS [Malania oleifera]XP_057967724.1 protein NEGATIVE GRAVITROPIC RESPONSE OF ROOTS [Malania oleifera]XP_057967725.1 protein NEGATIVE GRAVITROPIC RESPONSE OF ROOTS [Malania oleifera]